MEIKEIGEFGLIKLLAEGIKLDPNRVVLGIGDDAAVLKQDGSKLLLATTDTMTEGIHFLFSTTSPEQLGYKSLTVNVSDIAAMGGLPTAALVSLTLPKKIECNWVNSLYRGIKEACNVYGVNLVGGDTVSSLGGITLTVTLLGEVEPDCLIRRSGAKPGDLLGVTGPLGGSAAGLRLLSLELNRDLKGAEAALARHLKPEARLWAGRNLAKTGKVHSLNDISDGLCSEVLEIAEASGVGVVLNARDIPVDPAAWEIAEYTGDDPLDWALYGGEDYELVFSFSPEGKGEIEAALAEAGCSLRIIGEIVRDREKKFINFPDGRLRPLKALGYNHFN
ncbi:MAG TPA: thiamine-phosphate kinase [Clostridia bacterium]|nr:thiamine-phosphate kinase [Clostridia bacterium]